MPPKAQLDELELKLLHGQGLSDEQIAARMHSRRETIRDRRKQLGLPTSYPVRELALSQIRRDVTSQMRLELKAETVDTYAEGMQAGRIFPPVVVFRDAQETYWLGDGWHRLAAAERLGQATIPAEVRPGGLDEAIDSACFLNTEHGLPLSTADKRKAVAIQLTRHPERSDRAIARLVGCSPATVGTRRKELEAQTVSVQTEQIEHPSPSGHSEQIATAQRERVVTRGGTVYTQKLPRRRQPAAPEPPPAPQAPAPAPAPRPPADAPAPQRSRMARARQWAEAVATLQRLQAAYQQELAALDDDADATTRARLEAVCRLDLAALAVELP